MCGGRDISGAWPAATQDLYKVNAYLMWMGWLTEVLGSRFQAPAPPAPYYCKGMGDSLGASERGPREGGQSDSWVDRGWLSPRPRVGKEYLVLKAIRTGAQ